MAPLGTMVLGIIVLKERPSPAQKVAIVLAAGRGRRADASLRPAAVVALVIAVAWSVYGLLKRRVPLPAIEGFAAESFVLVVPALDRRRARPPASADSIPRQRGRRELVLVSLRRHRDGGALILFAFAATRVPFTVLGPLQYLVPTINFLLGWVLYDEELPVARLSASGWCGRRC